MDGGKCTNIFTKNVQKSECCAAGTDLGWSENDISDAELFFMAALNTGTTCSSCVGKCVPFSIENIVISYYKKSENCATAKCGPNKRCVIRQGQPKCICAPNCKQTRMKNPKLNSVTVIGVHDNFKSVKKKSLLTPGTFSNQNQTPKSDSSSSSNSNSVDRSQKNIRHQRQKKLLSRYHHRRNDNKGVNDAETVLMKRTENKIRLNTFLLEEKSNNNNNDQSTKVVVTTSKNDIHVSFDEKFNFFLTLI